jgi:hypothetical protein
VQQARARLNFFPFQSKSCNHSSLLFSIQVENGRDEQTDMRQAKFSMVLIRDFSLKVHSPKNDVCIIEHSKFMLKHCYLNDTANEYCHLGILGLYVLLIKQKCIKAAICTDL